MSEQASSQVRGERQVALEPAGPGAAPLPRLPRRPTSATAIYAALRETIVSMQMLPGAQIQEKLLAERFGVSRTPVREALLRLVEEELVEIVPQSATRVARVPVAAIPEAVVIRTALEGATVERAAERAGEQAVAALDAVIAHQRLLAGAGDTRGFHEADEAFHEAIAEIAGLPGVWRLLRSVKVQIDRARRLTLPALGRMDQVIGEHQAIRHAIATGDAAAARAAMNGHLSAVIPDVDRLRLDHPQFFI